MATTFAPLNWKEIELLAPVLDRELKGLYLERLFIPERPRFPHGFLKGEWAFRFGGKGRERTLILSIRPRHPYAYLLEGKGPKAAPRATHAGFDLALSKVLKGTRIASIQALPRERVLLLAFDSSPPYALAHFMIPALPELWLLQRSFEDEAWNMVARSRNRPLEEAILPDGSRAPPDLSIRGTWISEPETLANAIDSSLAAEAFESRARTAEQALKEARKAFARKLSAAKQAVSEAGIEPDYRAMGDLLTSILYTQPRPIDRQGKRYWIVPDYETGQEVEIEGSPTLDARAQAERYYHLERRKQRRQQEGQERARQLETNLAKIDRTLQSLPKSLDQPHDWEALKTAESRVGIEIHPEAAPAGSSKKQAPRLWSGRTFQSKDGITILVGKTRDENLELTFKVARGNDVWMHLRGRPGAHVVIPVQPGKSTPLETLLDAAVLAVFYSGGEHWGKTEVDYTFKKYVKRIRDSTEASYTQNKTLIVEPEPERLQRLLKQLE